MEGALKRVGRDLKGSLCYFISVCGDLAEGHVPAVCCRGLGLAKENRALNQPTAAQWLLGAGAHRTLKLLPGSVEQR